MRLAPVVLAAAALAPAPSARAPVTCRYRMDYRGDITRIQVMHHNLTRETIPFRSVGVLTVRLTDSATARQLDLSLDSLSVTRDDGKPLTDVAGGAGSRWQGAVAPDGDIVALTSPPWCPVPARSTASPDSSLRPGQAATPRGSSVSTRRRGPRIRMARPAPSE